MGFKKCPRCELNYIRDTETYCKVCLREMRGEEPREEVELCTVCNEAPAMPGKDVCLFCWKEMQARGDKEAAKEDDEDDDIGLDDAVDDDIMPDVEEEDIPEDEYQQINNDLSLEEMEEEENKEEDDSEENN